MRVRRGAAALLLFIVLNNPVHVYAGQFFESNQVEGDSGDTLNFNSCFIDGILAFSPMELDIKHVTVIAVEGHETGDGAVP